MNENNALIAGNRIDPTKLDFQNYTSTLAEEALRVGLFTEDDVSWIQMGLMESLSEVIGFYTKGESTSVKMDHASEFSKAILYNVDVYLMTLADHERAAELLKSKKISELYGKGYLINKGLYEKAKVLYGKARYSRLSNGSTEYNKTLDKYLYNYLKMYNPKFSAHDKLYVNLPELGFKGGIRINRVVELLEEIIKLNAGTPSDIIM